MGALAFRMWAEGRSDIVLLTVYVCFGCCGWTDNAFLPWTADTINLESPRLLSYTLCYFNEISMPQRTE
jgi:hypothetical protein